MSIYIFIALIVGCMFIRYQFVSIKETAKELEGEHDYIKIERLSRKLIVKGVIVFILVWVSPFYYALVLQYGIAYLFGIEYTYWLVFGAYVLYHYTLKPMRA